MSNKDPRSLSRLRVPLEVRRQVPPDVLGLCEYAFTWGISSHEILLLLAEIAPKISGTKSQRQQGKKRFRREFRRWMERARVSDVQSAPFDADPGDS